MKRLLAVTLLMCIPVSASTTGSAEGRVLDRTGAVIGHASIHITNVQTGATREVLSDASGKFSFPLLSPSTYDLEVSASGFSGRSLRIEVSVDSNVHVDVLLDVAALPQSVTITTNVHAVGQAAGEVITARDLRDLPLNERNFMVFATLTAGVLPGAEGSALSSQGGGFSASGAREQANNFVLEGIDNNNPLVNQYAAVPPLEAIEEFKVQTSGSGADFGRNAGAQVNVVLKNGGTSFHGNVFGFFRNRALDAKNYFDLPDCTTTSINETCSEIPALDRQQFGASLGGPLWQKRTSFYLAYEGLQLRQATTRRATVPSEVQREAVLAAVPEAERNSTGMAVFNLLPRTNVGPDLSLSTSYLAAPTIRDSVHRGLVKITHSWGAANLLSAHYLVNRGNRFNPFDLLQPATNLPGYGTRFDNRAHSAGVSWTHGSARLVNQLRVAYTRRVYNLFQESAGIDHSTELGFPRVLPRTIDFGYPIVTISGFDGIGESRVLPQASAMDIANAMEDMAWVRGAHSLKFGGEFRHFHAATFLDALARGQWFFLGAFTSDPLQDLVRGLPTLALATSGTTDSSLHVEGMGFYAQDEWKATEKLTLTAGLRWEYSAPPLEGGDRLSIADLGAASATCSPVPACQFIIAGTQGVPRGIYPGDWNNLAPRLGMAWQPFGTGPVLRAGYGVYYDTTILNLNILPRLNPPFFTTGLFANFGTSTIQTILSQPALPSPAVAIQVARSFKAGYLQQWRSVVEQNFGSKSFSIAYVGSKGTSLDSSRNLNQSQPGGAPPYPQFGPLETFVSRSSSVYHSLQAEGRARWRTVTGEARYTWGRSIDDASADFSTDGEPGIPQDSFNIAAERGLSAFHASHRFVGTFAVQTPRLNRASMQRWIGSWTFAGILVLQSGRPFTVTRSVDQSQSGNAALGFASDRPNQIADPFRTGPVAANPDPACQLTSSAGGRAADRVHTPDMWFNPCAFADPGVAFGSAGRNSFIGPGLQDFDLTIGRTIVLGEGKVLDLKAQFFNTFNHPNFDLPDHNFDSFTFATVRSSDRSGLKPPRQMQAGVKFSF